MESLRCQIVKPEWFPSSKILLGFLQAAIFSFYFLFSPNYFFSFYRCPKKPKTTLTFASSSYLPVSSPKTSPTKKKLSHLSLLSPLHTSSCFFFSCQLLPTPCSYLDRHFLYLVPTIPFPTTPLLHYFNHRHCLVTSLPHIPCRLAPPENKKGSYSRVWEKSPSPRGVYKYAPLW